jgi:predicted ribonuclease YlaK
MNLTNQQQQVFDAIKEFMDSDASVFILKGYAGTGKTTVALGTANLLVQYGYYDGIVYIISPTQEERQGYLPGSLEEKSAPYIEPLQQAMVACGIQVSTSLISSDNMKAQKEGTAYIEFMVDTYLRGCNFENKVVIIDETQNYRGRDLKKTLTRIHDNCKVIIIGHTEQCDLKRDRETSGFYQYLNAFQHYLEKYPDDKRVKICELTENHRGWFSTFCDDVELL